MSPPSLQTGLLFARLIAGFLALGTLLLSGCSETDQDVISNPPNLPL